MAGPPYNVLVQEIGGVVPKGRGEQISADEADQYDIAHLIAAGAIAGTGADLPPQASVGRTLTGVAPFDPAAVYVPGQVATDGVRAYVCTARTTTPGTAPSADGAHWSQLAGVCTPFYAAVTGGTQALDPSAHGGFHMDVLHDVTLSLSANAVEGQLYTMALDGDPSVPRIVTFGGGFTALGATLVLAAGSTIRLLFVGHDHLLEEAQPTAVPAPAGVPVLHGPYVVDYTDIPTEGDKMTLFTPEAGTVLLRLFPDRQTAVAWDSGTLSIGQDVDGEASPNVNIMCNQPAGSSPTIFGLDLVLQSASGLAQNDAGSNSVQYSAYVFHGTDPVQIQVTQTGGIDPTMGHVELYSLVCKAVPPQ